MTEWENMLLVAGTNRNVGKTTFACHIIKQISEKHKVVGLKITPHIHELCKSCNVIFESEDLTITEETGMETGKDSSKMLAAGAQRVFYVQGADNKLDQIVSFIKPLIARDTPVVCESAALRNIVIPGLFVLMSKRNSKVKNIEKIPLADIHIIDFNYDSYLVDFNKGKWKKVKKI